MEKIHSLISPNFYGNNCDPVSSIVQKACIRQLKEKKFKVNLTLDSKLLGDLAFTMKDIVYVLSVVRKQLFIQFSYDIIMEQTEQSTVRSLGEQVWLKLEKAIKYN